MILNNLEKHWRSLLLISFSSVLFFLLFLILGMIFYPDGLSSIGYNGFDGYSFWNNYISDLGMTHTFGGVPNPVSSLFLLIGIIILSIGSSLFYLLVFSVFSNVNKNMIGLSTISTISGIIGCIFLLGVSIFPKDTELELHEIISFLFFGFTIIAVVIYNHIILKNDALSNKYTLLGYLFIICGLIYAIVPKFIFPQLDDETLYTFKPTSQKIVVISLLVALINYMLMIKRVKSPKESPNIR